VNFDRVLLIADNNKVEIGKPYLKGHSVEAEVLKTGRSKKNNRFSLSQQNTLS